MELVFLAAQLPPLGVKSYHVERLVAIKNENQFIKRKHSYGRADDYVIANEVSFIII